MTRLLAVAAALLLAAQAPAQSLGDRIAAVRDGTVELHFRARPGICANEDGGMSWMRNRGDVGDWIGRNGPCLTGPVVVSLSRTGNDVVSVRTRIAARPTGAGTDLGEVSPREAGAYLTGLAHRIGGRSGSDALTAAAIADGFDVWPDFRRLVMDADAPMQSREQALFWIGQSETPTSNLIALYGDLTPLSLREHYTFVISQRRNDDQALDKLIDVARHDRDAGVRKQAMFWLGQSHSPKATKFFRDVLSP